MNFIKIIWIWTQISCIIPCNTHLKQPPKVCLCIKTEKCGDIAKGNLSNITGTVYQEPGLTAVY